MTPRPSSSGTSSPGRRREAFTAKALLIGQFSSRWTVGAWRPRAARGQSLHWSSSRLRWSHDGKFFARMTLDTLSIYETPVSEWLHYRGMSRAGFPWTGGVEPCVPGLVILCQSPLCSEGWGRRGGWETWTVSGVVTSARAHSHQNLRLPFCKNIVLLRHWPVQSL